MNVLTMKMSVYIDIQPFKVIAARSKAVKFTAMRYLGKIRGGCSHAAPS